jgi:hypothetical protein
MKPRMPNRRVYAELTAPPLRATPRACACGEPFFIAGDRCPACITAAEKRARAYLRRRAAAHRRERSGGIG